MARSEIDDAPTAADFRPKNAYDVYDAYFDPARAEHVPEDREARIDDVIA